MVLNGEPPTNPIGPMDKPANPPPLFAAPPPQTPPPPLEMRGFWRSVDFMLHHPDSVRAALQQDVELGKLSFLLFRISVIMAALYGAVMGATNLLQGSEMALQYKLLTILVTACKVPVLFLLTLVIIFPPVYVSNAFVGARLTFRQMMAILLASTAITVTVLASMATVAFFFSLTSTSYDFLKLLHVLFFAYAGLVGVNYLMKSVEAASRNVRAGKSSGLLVLWLLLYMFVGTQLAWVLRPFVGAPTQQFQVFRPRSGNFYESVLNSMGKVTRERFDD